jgi:hypothetical protein
MREVHLWFSSITYDLPGVARNLEFAWSGIAGWWG